MRKASAQERNGDQNRRSRLVPDQPQPFHIFAATRREGGEQSATLVHFSSFLLQFFGRHESELQEFLENPVIVWGTPIAELLDEAGLLIKSLRDSDNVNRMTLLLHGASHTGKTALAVHLAQQTGFTFIRMCSIRNMIGFTESGRCLAMKKVSEN